MLRRTVFLIVSVWPIQATLHEARLAIRGLDHNVWPKSPALEASLRIQLSQAIKRGSSQHMDRGRIEERTLR